MSRLGTRPARIERFRSRLGALVATTGVLTSMLVAGGAPAAYAATVGTGNCVMTATGAVTELTSSVGSDGKTSCSFQFTSHGSFQVPVGVTSLNTVVIGGGGGGGSSRGGGGGGGGVAVQSGVAATAGETFSVIVASGGAGASTANTAGADGQDSWLARGSNAGSDTRIAQAGGGGGGGGWGQDGRNSTNPADGGVTILYAASGGGGGAGSNFGSTNSHVGGSSTASTNTGTTKVTGGKGGDNAGTIDIPRNTGGGGGASGSGVNGATDYPNSYYPWAAVPSGGAGRSVAGIAGYTSMAGGGGGGAAAISGGASECVYHSAGRGSGVDGGASGEEQALSCSSYSGAWTSSFGQLYAGYTSKSITTPAAGLGGGGGGGYSTTGGAGAAGSVFISFTLIKTVTVTAQPQTLTFTGQPAAGTPSSTLSGQQAGETLSSVSYNYYASNYNGGVTTTTRPTGVGTYTVTPFAANLSANTGSYNYSYVSSTLTITKATPTFGTFTDMSRNGGDADFTVTNPTVNPVTGGTDVPAGTWSYASSSPSVATISTTGMVHLVSSGTTTITATFTITGSSTNWYTSSGMASPASTLTVSKTTPTFGSWSNVTKYMGDADFAPSAPAQTTSNGNTAGSWSYSSSNTSVATVVSNSTMVHLVANGTSTITATFTPANTSLYSTPTSSTFTVTVNKQDGTFSAWNSGGIAKTFGDVNFSLVDPTQTTSIPGTWSYASGTASVATITGTHDVHIVGAGSSTITATFTPTDTATYNTYTVNATLTVAKATLTFSFPAVSMTVGDSDLAIVTPTITALPNGTVPSGTWSYSSGTTSVATIVGGSYHLLIGGTSTITATFTPTDTTSVNGGSTTMTLSVSKATPVFSGSPLFSNVNKTYGDAAFAPTAPTQTTSIAGSWSYASSNTAVISGTTTLTVAGAGNATITATFTPTDTTKYSVVTTSFTVTVATGSSGVAIDPGNTASTGKVGVTQALRATFASGASGTLTFYDNGTAIPGCTNLTTSTTAVLCAGSWNPSTAGTHLITATLVPSSGNFATATSASYTITIALGTPAVLSGTFSPTTGRWGDSPATITPRVMNVPGTWSYVSNNTATVRIVNGNQIQFVQNGSTSVTATFTPTDTTNYGSYTESFSVGVYGSFVTVNVTNSSGGTVYVNGVAQSTTVVYSFGVDLAITFSLNTGQKISALSIDNRVYTASEISTAVSSGLTLSTGTTTPHVIDVTFSAASFVLSWDARCGGSVQSTTYAYGSTTSVPAAPTCSGKTFYGWYTNSSFTGGAWYTARSMPANDVTLYAGWIQNATTGGYSYLPSNGTLSIGTYNGFGYATAGQTMTFSSTEPTTAADVGSIQYQLFKSTDDGATYTQVGATQSTASFAVGTIAYGTQTRYQIRTYWTFTSTLGTVTSPVSTAELWMIISQALVVTTGPSGSVTYTTTDTLSGLQLATRSGGAGGMPTGTVQTGTLPPGTYLYVTGDTIWLNGAPTTPGTYQFTVRLTDGNGAYGDSSQITIYINKGTPNFSIATGLTSADFIYKGGGTSGYVVNFVPTLSNSPGTGAVTFALGGLSTFGAGCSVSGSYATSITVRANKSNAYCYVIYTQAADTRYNSATFTDIYVFTAATLTYVPANRTKTYGSSGTSVTPGTLTGFVGTDAAGQGYEPTVSCSATGYTTTTPVGTVLNNSCSAIATDFYKVAAITNAGTTTVVAAAITTPTPTVAATTGSVRSINVSWAAPLGAVSYTVRLYDSTGSTLLATISNIATTSYRITTSDYAGLAEATYKVSLQALGDGMNYSDGSESSKISVTTLPLPIQPTITVQPTATVSKDAGQSYSVSVTANAGNGTLSYQWYKDGNAISGATSATYSALTSLATTDAGSYTVVVTNTLNGTTSTRTSNASVLTVYVVPTITTPSTGLSGTYNSAYSLSLVSANGSGGNVWTIVAGSLIGGLSLDSSTGVISGTPTAVGNRTVTVRVTDSNGVAATTSSFTISIAKASQTITSWSLPANRNINAGAFTSAFTLNSGLTGTLWTGTTSVCTVSGQTVTLVGVGTCTIYAQETSGNAFYNTMPANDNMSFNVTAITTTFNSNYGTATTSTQTISTPGNVAIVTNSFVRTGYNFAGWNTAANGSGTPYANGQAVTFTANTTLYAQWTVNATTLISPVPTALATTGSIRSITVTWAAVTGTVSYTVRLYNSAGTTLLATIPNLTGTSRVITTADYSSITEATYMVSVQALGDGTFYLDGTESSKTSVTTLALPVQPTIDTQPTAAVSRDVTQAYSVSVSASTTDGGTLSYQWYKDGALIVGATSATFSNITNLQLADAASYTVVVTNTLNGTTSTRTSNASVLSVYALPVFVAVTTTARPTGTAFTIQLTVTGGSGGTAYSLASGSFPTGVTMDSAGLISGTPTVVGTYTVVVRAVDSNGGTATDKTFSIVVSKGTLATVTGVTATTDGSSLKAFTVTWNAVNYAYNYEVRVVLKSNSTTTCILTTGVGATNILVNPTNCAGLTELTDYYIYVRALADASNNFTTGSLSASITYTTTRASLASSPTVDFGSNVSPMTISASNVTLTVRFSTGLYKSAGSDLTMEVRFYYNGVEIPNSAVTKYFSSATVLSATFDTSYYYVPLTTAANTVGGSGTYSARVTLTSFGSTTTDSSSSGLSKPLVVYPAITAVTPNSNNTATTGVYWSWDLRVTGGNPSKLVLSPNPSWFWVPSWMTFDTVSARLYGTPNTSGIVATWSVRVSDGSASVDFPLSLNVLAGVQPNLTVSATPSSSAFNGTGYSKSIVFAFGNVEPGAASISNNLSFTIDSRSTAPGCSIPGQGTLTQTLTATGPGVCWIGVTYPASPVSTTWAATTAYTTVTFTPLTLTTRPAPTLAVRSGNATSLAVTFSSDARASGYVVRVFSDAGGTTQVSGDWRGFSPAGPNYITGLTTGTTYYVGVIALGTGNYSDSSISTLSALAPVQTSQSITFNALPSKTYGAADFTLSATASSGLAVTFSTTSAATICVVNGSTVSIRGAGTCDIRASQAGNTDYSAASDVLQSLTINPKALTVTATVTPNTKEYGSTAPTVGFTTSGLVNGDSIDSVTFTWTGPGGYNANAPPGATDPVGTYTGTPSAPVFGTGDVRNYLVTYTAVSYVLTAATISTPSAPTASATANKTRSIDAAWSADARANSYTIKLYESDGTTLRATITGVSRNATSYTITTADYSGLVAAHAYKVAIIVVGDGVSYNSSTMSALTSVTTNTAAGTITSNTVSIDYPNRTQGQTAVLTSNAVGNGTLTYQWKHGGQDISGATGATLSLSNLAAADAGSYAVAVTNTLNDTSVSATSSAATLTIAGQLGISNTGSLSATVDLPFTFTPITAGGATPFSYALASGSLPTGLSLVSSTGEITGSPRSAGTFTISLRVTDNNGASYTSALFAIVVAKGTQVAFSFTASTTTSRYNESGYSEAITFTPAGGSGSGAVSYAIAASGSTATTCAISNSNGTYTLTASTSGTCVIEATKAADADYNATTATFTFTFTKAPLTITASSPQVTYGSAAPTINGTASGVLQRDAGQAPYSGLVCSTAYTVTSDARSNPLTSCTGATSANYTITYVSGSVDVRPAPATITARSANVTYGTAAPTIGADYTGLLNGATAATTAPTCTVTGYTTASAGGSTWTTSCSGASDNNYVFGYVTGTLTVVQAAQTVTFSQPSAKTYGDADVTLTASASSGLAVSFATSSASTICVITGSTLSIRGAGSCVIIASQAGDGNYQTASASVRTLTINPKAITVTATVAPNSQTYGSADPTLGYSVSGLVGTDAFSTVDVRYTSVGGYDSHTAPSAVGSYSVVPSAAVMGTGDIYNYSITYANASYTITRQQLATPVVNTTATREATGSTVLHMLVPYVANAVGYLVQIYDAATGGHMVGSVDLRFQVPLGGYQTTFDTHSINTVYYFTVTAVGDQLTYVDSAESMRVQAETGWKVNAITFNALPNQTYGDADVNLSATNTAGTTVSFGSLTIGTCTVSGTLLLVRAAGTCTIRASDVGNGVYDVSPVVDQSFSVAKANLTVSVTLSTRTNTYPGTNLSFSATLSGLARFDSFVSATITFINNGTSATTTTPPSGYGSYTVRPSNVALGSSVMGNYNITYVDESYQILKGMTSVTARNPGASVTYGVAQTLAARPNQPGTITFLIGGVAVCSAVAATTTTDATCSWTPTGVGSTTYSVQFTPTDGNYLSATDSVTFTVLPASTTSVVVVVTASPIYGSTMTVRATTSQAGTVEFKLDGVVVCAAITTDGSLQASCDWNPTGAGTHTVDVRLTPTSGNYSASTDTLGFSVAKKALTIGGLTGVNKVYNGNATGSVSGTATAVGTVNGDAITITGTPTVSFADANVGNGKALTVSGYTLSNSTNYSLTQPAGLTANITQAASTATVVNATSNLTYGGGAALRATLSGAGTVEYTIDGVVAPCGTQTVDVHLETVCQWFPDRAGDHTVDIRFVPASGNYTTVTDTLGFSVAKKVITVIGLTGVDKFYDGNTTATLTGLADVSGQMENNDTVTLSGTWTATFANATAGIGKAITVTGYSISGSFASNYILAQPTGLTANINSAATSVTVAVVNINPTYGSTVTLQATASQSGYVEFKLDGVVVCASVATDGGLQATCGWIPSSAGIHTIDVRFTPSSTNYTFSVRTFGFTVAKKAVTIGGLTGVDKVYDGNTTGSVTGTATVLGLANGDNVTITGSPTVSFADANVGNGKPLTVTGYGLSNYSNYTLTQPSGITASITLSASTASVVVVTASPTYGSTVTVRATASQAGTIEFKLDGTVVCAAVATDGSLQATCDWNPTSAGAHTVDVRLSPTSANYSAATYTLGFSVAKKALTIGGLTGADKVYDGATTGSVSGTPSAVGVVNGDSITITGTPTVNFADANVGSAKPLTITGYGLSSSTNYTLTQPAGLTASITQAVATAAALVVVTASPTYGSTVTVRATANQAGTVEFKLDGTVVCASVATNGSFQASCEWNPTSAGAHTLDVRFSPTSSNFSASNSTLGFSVAKKALTIGGLTGVDKVYDGNTTGSVSGAPTAVGLANGDNVTITGTPTVNFADANVGNAKPLTVTGYGLSNAANYTVSQPSNLTASITTAATTSVVVVVTASPTYGSTVTVRATTSQAGTVQFKLDGVVVCASVATDGSLQATCDWNPTSAGAHTVDVRLSPTSGNYAISTDTLGFSVAKKALTIGGLTGVDKVYDGNMTGSVSGTATPVGLVNGDSITITGTPTVTFADANIGTNKALTVTGYTLSNGANYTVSQPTGLTANITAAGTTSVVVVVTASPTYGSTVTVRATVSQAGNVEFKLDGTVVCAAVATDGSLQATCDWNPTSAGTHTVDVRLTPTSNNFSVSTGTLGFSVAKKTLTVTGVTGVDKIYNGSTSGSLTGTAAPVGLVNGDSITIIGTPTVTFADASVGTNKPLTVSGYALSSAANYTLTQPTGLTASITRATTSVTVPAVSGAVYGTDVVFGMTATQAGTLSVTVDGVSVCSSISAAANTATSCTWTPDHAGSHTAVVTFTPTSSNYSGSNATVNFSVAAKAITVTATVTPVSQAYGSSAPTKNFTVSGLVRLDVIGSVSYTFSGTNTSTAPTAVGSYTLTPSAASFSNGLITDYVISYVAASYTVINGTPTAVITTSVGTSATYNSPAVVTVTVSQPGTVTVRVDSTPLCTGVATSNGAATCNWTPAAAGTSVITAELTPADNGYSVVNATSVTVSVARAAQTITISNTSARIWGDAPFALTATSTSGLTVAIASTTPLVCSYSGGLVTILHIGTCVISATQAGDSNYLAASTATRSITISPLQLVWSATPVVSIPAGVRKQIHVVWNLDANATGYVVRIYDQAGTNLLFTLAAVTGNSVDLRTSNFAQIADNSQYNISVQKIAVADALDSVESTKVTTRVNAIGNVTYSANGATSGTAPAAQIFIEGGTPVAVSTNSGTLVNTGFSYMGWNTAADGSGTNYVADGTATYSATTDVTMFARWSANALSVTFNSNYGTPTTVSQLFTAGASQDLRTNTFVRAGYIFNGWATSAAGAVVYTDAQSLTTVVALTLYANWTAINYSIHYLLNGGSGSAPIEPTHIIGQIFTVAGIGAVSRTGYDFGGWSDGTTVYQPGATYTLAAADVNLTAVWNLQHYTITYNPNGATGAASRTSDDFPYGSAAISLPSVGTMVKPGYSFIGWSVNGSAPAIAGSYSTNASVTLKAIWQANTYLVTYNTNGATGAPQPATANYTTDATAVTLATVGTMVKPGYTFGGWSTTANGTALSGTYATLVDVTLYAVWNAIAYSVSYDLRGGTSVVPTEANHVIGDRFNLASAPTLNGFYFAGWNDGTSTYQAGYSYQVGAANVQLTAVWVQIFYVHYNFNGSLDAAPADNPQLDGTVIASITAPTRTGYTFAGWRDQSGALIGAGSNFTVGATHFILNAEWQAISRTVTYVNSGGQVPTEANHIIGDSFAVATVQARTGYTFGGWTDGSATYAWNSTYVVGNSNVTLTALWTLNSYPIIYDLNLGTSAPYSNQSYPYNQILALPNGPLRHGYAFAGWSISGQIYQAGSALNMPAGPLTLTATWTAIANSVSYDLGGAPGTAPTESARTIGQTFTIAAEPVWLNHDFLGWSDGTTIFAALATYTDAGDPVTLTARWANSPSIISFMTRSGSGVAPALISSTVGSSITLPNQAGLINSGYNFAGWDDGAATYQPGATYAVAATAVTFIAVWTAIPAPPAPAPSNNNSTPPQPTTVTIQFNLGGAAGSAPTKVTGAVGSWIILPTAVTATGGVKFAGWTDGTKTYPAGAKYQLFDGASGMTALWTVLPVITTQNAVTVTYGQPTQQLVATSSAGSPLQWTTSSPVCRISASGEVTALAAGDCEVQVVDSVNQITKTVVVKVAPRLDLAFAGVTNLTSTSATLAATVQWPGADYSVKFCVTTAIDSNNCVATSTISVNNQGSGGVSTEGPLTLARDVTGLQANTVYFVRAAVITGGSSYLTTTVQLVTPGGKPLYRQLQTSRKTLVDWQSLGITGMLRVVLDGKVVGTTDAKSFVIPALVGPKQSVQLQFVATANVVMLPIDVSYLPTTKPIPYTQFAYNNGQTKPSTAATARLIKYMRSLYALGFTKFYVGSKNTKVSGNIMQIRRTKYLYRLAKRAFAGTEVRIIMAKRGRHVRASIANGEVRAKMRNQILGIY